MSSNTPINRLKKQSNTNLSSSAPSNINWTAAAVSKRVPSPPSRGASQPKFTMSDLVPPTPHARQVASTREATTTGTFELPHLSRDSRSNTMPNVQPPSLLKKMSYDSVSSPGGGRRQLQRTERSTSINIPKLVLLATYRPANLPAQTRGVLIDPDAPIQIVVKSLLREFELCMYHCQQKKLFSFVFQYQI